MSLVEGVGMPQTFPGQVAWSAWRCSGGSEPGWMRNTVACPNFQDGFKVCNLLKVLGAFLHCRAQSVTFHSDLSTLPKTL